MRATLVFLGMLSFLAPEGAVARLRVAATLPTLGAVVKEVGGDRVEVSVLASPEEDPHYVDPRPNLILVLNRADALVVNGLDLEVGWLPPLQAQARNGRIQTGAPGYLDASTLIPRLDVPTTPVDRAQGDIHPGGNPHYLFDARSLERVVRGVGEFLGRLDPEGAPEYGRRAETLAGSLEAFQREQAARIAALPVEKRRVVSYHRSFPYLYQWLGLEEVATIEPRPGIPPDPGHVARVLATMKATGARVIVQETWQPRNTSQTLARLVGGTVVVLPGGVDLSRGESLLDHLRQVAGGVIHALQH
ncbi:MAG TPA: metal ABC transporter substrate-binding protein [Myxococcota bacterium]|nr:metal ABC transporter substrate-binding protein [Myxococcota bacterium]HQK51525.1 metal ABC transporter substrate-binding protein [Myxococcota bacterium]